jgi:hypothetical protein
MSVIVNASTSTGLGITSDNSGNVEIRSNGTTKLTVSSTGVSGAITATAAVASTSGNAIDFTNIPSWVKRITINLNNVSTNGVSALIAQTGSSSFDTSGYVSFATIITASAGVAGMANTNGHLLDMTRLGVAGAVTGSIVLNQIATNVWASSGITYRVDTVVANYMITGNRSTSSTLDRIRITTVGGTDTFDAGSITLFYEG